MSLIIKNLCKIYGHQKALDDISFEVKPGEIVGFLGPNGAGKSTTMKIATCYLSATSGSVEVCGLDTTKHSIEVRRQIGYLPEHNPLYTDMYVREFLEFVGKLYNMAGQHLKKRVAEVIEQVGLGPEQNKKIEQLSKGYRQRVGLAQAFIHNPAVLILDEPTTGLDPNQLVEIRQVIREIGRAKTVIFSTHIMQEVEALCSSVVLIDHGKIVANGQLAAIRGQKSMEQIFRELTAPNPGR
jgi:ABC-2 type transport system ATP-binding protein